MAMWYFLLFLGVCVTSEEIKHNLPEGLEIVDPKSLGLKTDDLDKLLGNVKLLPIASGNVGDTKTQILTVGFDGDEKLNLDDFELPANFNLPEKDQEIAQVAFKQFQDYIQNKGNNNGETTTSSTISVTTPVAEQQQQPQKQQHRHRNSEENRSRQQHQQHQQHHRQVLQNNQIQNQQPQQQKSQPRNSGENFQQPPQSHSSSFININLSPPVSSQEQFQQQINQQAQNNQNQQQQNFQGNPQQQQLPQTQIIFPNPNQIHIPPQHQHPNHIHHQPPPPHMSHMAFHSNPNQQINYQVINHASGPVPVQPNSRESYQTLNYQNSPPQVKHNNRLHQKPYRIFPPQHQNQQSNEVTKISQTKLVPAYEATSTEIFGARLKNRNIETFSGNFNPPKEVVRNFIPNIVTTQRSILEVTPSMPMIPLSTNENAIRNFSRVNFYQNYHRSQEQFEYNNRQQNHNQIHNFNNNDNNFRNFNLNQNNNFPKNFKPNVKDNVQQQNFPHNPNQNQNRFVPPQAQAQPSQNFETIIYPRGTPSLILPSQHHQPQPPNKIRNTHVENVSQQSVAYAQVHPFSTFNQNNAVRPNAFAQNASPSGNSESALPPRAPQQNNKPQLQPHSQSHSQNQSHAPQSQTQNQQPYRNRRQSYGNKLMTRFRRLFHF